MQNRLNANGFIEKTEWPSSSPDFNPLDCHIWGTMLEKYHKLQPKHKTTDELKVALQTILGRDATRTREQGGGDLHQVPDCLVPMAVAANGGHSEHLQLLCPSASLHPHLITKKLALFRDTNRLSMKIMLGMLRNWGFLVEIA